MLIFYTVLTDNDDDKARLEEIYNKYRKKMWYAANSVLSDAYLSEDAVHNAFIGIAKNIGKLRDVDSSKTLSYVITAAKNAAIDILRKNKSGTFSDIDELYDVSDTENSSFCKTFETENLIEKILAEMPAVYRDVLYFSIVHEMSAKEIAALLGRRTGTVHQQIRRGKMILQNELRKGETTNERK